MLLAIELAVDFNVLIMQLSASPVQPPVGELMVPVDVRVVIGLLELDVGLLLSVVVVAAEVR